jgi:hypothetical protein
MCKDQQPITLDKVAGILALGKASEVILRSGRTSTKVRRLRRTESGQVLVLRTRDLN